MHNIKVHCSLILQFYRPFPQVKNKWKVFHKKIINLKTRHEVTWACWYRVRCTVCVFIHTMCMLHSTFSVLCMWVGFSVSIWKLVLRKKGKIKKKWSYLSEVLSKFVPVFLSGYFLFFFYFLSSFLWCCFLLSFLSFFLQLRGRHWEGVRGGVWACVCVPRQSVSVCVFLEAGKRATLLCAADLGECVAATDWVTARVRERGRECVSVSVWERER